MQNIYEITEEEQKEMAKTVVSKEEYFDTLVEMLRFTKVITLSGDGEAEVVIRFFWESETSFVQ